MNFYEDRRIYILPNINSHTPFTSSFSWMVQYSSVVFLLWFSLVFKILIHSGLAKFYWQIEVLVGTVFPEFLTAWKWMFLAFIFEGQFDRVASSWFTLSCPQNFRHRSPFFFSIGYFWMRSWGKVNVILSCTWLAFSIGHAHRILSFFWILNLYQPIWALVVLCRFPGSKSFFASESFPLLALLIFLHIL